MPTTQRVHARTLPPVTRIVRHTLDRAWLAAFTDDQKRALAAAGPGDATPPSPSRGRGGGGGGVHADPLPPRGKPPKRSAGSSRT